LSRRLNTASVTRAEPTCVQPIKVRRQAYIKTFSVRRHEVVAKRETGIITSQADPLDQDSICIFKVNGSPIAAYVRRRPNKWNRIMKNLYVAIALSAVVTFPALAQTPAATMAPATSAYAGNTGDWALGRWSGMRYLDAGFSRMVTEDWVLVVSKQADGKVACQLATSAEIDRAAPVPKCTITGNGISIRTAKNAEVELSMDGGDLEGRYVELFTRNRLHLHRGGAGEPASKR